MRLKLESLVNHIALPLRLPGKLEDEVDQIEESLINHLLDVTRELEFLAARDTRHQWGIIRHTLSICKALNAGGRLEKATLLTRFRSLEHKEFLILHVSEQNAGLLIRRHYE